METGIGKSNAEYLAHLAQVKDGTMRIETVRQNWKDGKYPDVRPDFAREWARLAGVV